MAGVKVRLRFPTLGHKRGDVIEVDKAQAEALVANGSARRVPVEKPVKD
jgi:hypothetical protein